MATPKEKIKAILDLNIFTRDFIAKCCGLKPTTFYVYFSEDKGGNKLSEKHVEKLQKELDSFMLGTIKV